MALEVALEDLEGWLGRELAPVIEPLKAEGGKLFADIRGRLDDFREVCEKLLMDSEKEMGKESRKTYRSARTANKLARTVLDTLDEVVVPDDVSRESLQRLNEDFRKVFITVEPERRMSFPRIAPFFILARRRFDMTWKKVLESLETLRDFSVHKYVKAKTMEDAVSMINKLSQLLDEAERAEKRKERTESRKKILENKIAKKQKTIMAIRNRDEIHELVQVNKEIEELEGKVKKSLRHLQKPFFKFQTLARGPGQYLMLEEARKLDEYLNEPFKALATEEEGHPLLKSILRKMADAMNKGKLKLKSSRLRKAKGQIKGILEKDALIPLHRKCREALSTRQQLVTSESMAAFQKELEDHQKDLMELQRRKKFVDSKHAVLDGEYQEQLQKIASQRKELEETVFRLTGKKIAVT